jgi:phosphoglycolate phosphatase
MLLFLFDIDGTLLWSGGAGVAALNAAFWELFGIENSLQGISCDGMTDPAIVRVALRRHQLDSQENVQKILERYTDRLPESLMKATGIRLMEGVKESLEYLRGCKDILCGLATGNVQKGAWTKLGHSGIAAYFTYGGFGSDSEERYELVQAALHRGRLRAKNIWAKPVVIGDTPLDINAGKKVGALTVGVATGRFDLRSLAASGADLVFQNLREPELWVERVRETAATSSTTLPG